MRVRLSLAAGLLAALVPLAGCGSSSSSGNGVASKSATEIVSAAKAAADSASSVHVAGSTVTGGSPITLDLHLVSGKGGRGRISENGLGFELVQLEGTIYISGSPAFYTHFAGSAAAQLLQGKWLKAPVSSSSFTGISALTEQRKLMSSVLDAAVAHPTSLKVTGTTTVHGQAVVGVKDTSQQGTLYVATTGPAYPVEIAKSGSGGGAITFSAWNAPVTLTAPSPAVDIEKLQKGH